MVNLPLTLVKDVIITVKLVMVHLTPNVILVTLVTTYTITLVLTHVQLLSMVMILLSQLLVSDVPEVVEIVVPVQVITNVVLVILDLISSKTLVINHLPTVHMELGQITMLNIV